MMVLTFEFSRRKNMLHDFIMYWLYTIFTYHKKYVKLSGANFSMLTFDNPMRHFHTFINSTTMISLLTFQI